MPRTNITDDDGNIHYLAIRQQENGQYYVLERYSNEGFNTSENFDTPEKAIEDFTHWVINANCAKRFNEMPIDLQGRVLAFIQQHFQPGKQGNTRRYGSYTLKHIVERGIGAYISNGELKGAMRQAGFPVHKSTSLADINYVYVIKKIREKDIKEPEITKETPPRISPYAYFPLHTS